jgi:hypothetical protein
MKHITFFKIIVLLIVLSSFLKAQSNFDYSVSLVPVAVSNLPGLHSYAYAQSQGKWLIIGGRKDGLHARQPFNAFPTSQNNTDIYVVDVQNNQLWSASVNSLPTGIAEQLQSTNMNFYQDDDSLYVIGGYGFSVSSNNHITYPNLTSIVISDLINAIQNNQPIDSYFKQIQDNRFAITGGHLKKMGNLFYLVGGHRFDGRYNPMGNPTYTQTYSNQIRKFSIDNSGTQLSYQNYTEITDPVHLRRRDYNLLPQIFPNGEHGLTISSGVFQINADLPFLYPVDIRDSSYYPITTFNQYLSNYHCPVACLYDSSANNMHSIFFGGISQYYYQNGTLIQDNQVPFVKTISRLTRDANSNLTEYQLPVEMPSLKGAGAEFITNLNLPHYSNKVIRLNNINQNNFMIGHILGGIQSSSLNPFSNNQTNNTSADNTIYEVWLTLNPLSNAAYEIDGSNPFDISVSPNPFEQDFNISFITDKQVKMYYFITDAVGQIIYKSEEREYNVSEHFININSENLGQKRNLTITTVFDNLHYVSKKLIKK